eukprot:TRINITY_DN65787_c0_g1_i2.p1 TRINITY_DN65787_c0_g1~~TRINITY_DN65787_c0_g1_i2.p1  ORF type:complete len:360 (+),score=35.45 TRINITY_DN65787_c0_g1_i2:50-1081(+)
MSHADVPSAACVPLPQDAPEATSPLRVNVAADGTDGGRFYVANRPIHAGELLLVAKKADAAVVRDGAVSHTCATCFASSDGPMPLECGECGYVSYCSPRCQEADQPAHAVGECGPLRRLRASTQRGRDRTALRLALQVTHRIRAASEAAAAAEDVPLLALSDLCTGLDAFRSLGSWSERHGRWKALAAEFSDACEGDESWAAADLEALFGQIQCNSFDLWKKQRKRKLGIGLYASASLFNHSCLPNVARSQSGQRLEFYALADVSPGEALCIAYVDPRLPRERRRAELLEDYGFHCACGSCSCDAAEAETLALPSMCPRHLGYMVPASGAGASGPWCTVCVAG